MTEDAPKLPYPLFIRPIGASKTLVSPLCRSPTLCTDRSTDPTCNYLLLVARYARCMFDLTATLAELRAKGGDLPGIEVKSAAGGLPESIISTLCSFANRPGGGTIIVGLDEAAGFAPVGLRKPREMKSALAAKARSAFDPPITIHLEQGVVDGEAVIVGTVDELDLSQKPCRVSGGQHRGVWKCAWDGDYRASELEIQGLLTSRSQPRFDADAAPRSSREDLDSELVADFLRNCRSGSNQLARIHDDDELLWRMGVLIDADRTPSMAGILALGTYPQQHLPATGLQAILTAPPGEQRTTRALDSKRFDGPIPRIIADATSWVARSSATAVVSNRQTGRVTDNPTWPADAVRELIGNAIIHRDLTPWALARRHSFVWTMSASSPETPAACMDSMSAVSDKPVSPQHETQTSYESVRTSDSPTEHEPRKPSHLESRPSSMHSNPPDCRSRSSTTTLSASPSSSVNDQTTAGRPRNQTPPEQRSS